MDNFSKLALLIREQTRYVMIATNVARKYFDALSVLPGYVTYAGAQLCLLLIVESQLRSSMHLSHSGGKSQMQRSKDHRFDVRAVLNLAE